MSKATETMKIEQLRPEFVNHVPDQVEEGVLYISERFRICSHKCCCGCGEEVVTPLSPAEWRLTREGDLVSLWPSVGNWDYACRSHYVIKRNRVLQSPPMTDRQIARVQQRDATDLSRMIAATNIAKADQKPADSIQSSPSAEPPSAEIRTSEPVAAPGVWRSLWRALFGE
jgi:hypothetical protein